MSTRVRITRDTSSWRTNIDLKTSGMLGTILDVRGTDSTAPEAFVFLDYFVPNNWNEMLNVLWVPFWCLERIQ